jgi:hypothetical protein
MLTYAGGADGTEDYRDKVFTGTDEKIEDHKGTSGSAKYYPDDEQPAHVHYLKTKVICTCICACVHAQYADVPSLPLSRARSLSISL